MNPLVTIVIVSAALVALIVYVTRNNKATRDNIEMFEEYKRNEEQTRPDIMDEDPLAPEQVNYSVKPSEPLGKNETYKVVEESKENKAQANGNQFPTDCFPKDQLNPAELLPGDANSTWAKVAPNGQGELGDQNFLSAGYHSGMNTVGTTNRNPNLQLRSEPPNPQVAVSIWQQSTINPDLNRRGFEIGN